MEDRGAPNRAEPDTAAVAKAPTTRSFADRRPLLNRILLPVAVVVFYFFVPVSTTDAPIGEIFGVLIGLLSLVAVAWIIFDETRRAEKRLRPVHLLLAFELVLVTFSLTYYLLEVRDPSQFNSLETRLDALYFSMTTMATVGYGDVHATGQFARLLVTVQLAFNLVFVAALVSLFQAQVRSMPVGAVVRWRDRGRSAQTPDEADDDSA